MKQSNIKAVDACVNSTLVEMTPTPTKSFPSKTESNWAADYIISQSEFQMTLPTTHERLMAALKVDPLIVTSVDGCDDQTQASGGQKKMPKTSYQVLETII